jgi:hypothetical protein
VKRTKKTQAERTTPAGVPDAKQQKKKKPGNKKARKAQDQESVEPLTPRPTPAS